ncbi:MAG TPA: thioredoxin family protein [Pirellulales bacterium]|jgi:thioredoxin-related protein
MKTLPAWMLATVALLLIKPCLAAPPEVKWIPRIDLGQRLAADEKRDLMIVFTGETWCHYCTLLDRQVFQQPEFAEAKQDFVLVRLNFLGGDLDKLPDVQRQQQEQYEKWKSQYLIDGVPVVVLADQQARPFAYLGYEDEITAESFLAEARQAVAARKKRDEFLAAAEGAKSDGDRAKHLSDALQAIAPSLSALDERKNDPLLVFYADIVERIRQLDPDNAAGVRAIYDARVAALATWREKNEIWTQLEKDRDAKDYTGAIARIERALSSTEDASERWRLELVRQKHLEWDRQYERALLNSRRLLDDPNLTAENRQWLLTREAHDLINSNRIDEYLLQWQKRFDAAGGDENSRIKLLGERARYLRGRPEISKSVIAWQAFYDGAKAGSDDWLTATFFLASEQVRAGELEQAVRLWNELFDFCQALDPPAGSHVMLSIAEAQQAAGLYEAAQESLTKAESSLAAEAPQFEDPRDLERLNARVAKLRKLLP